MCDLLCLWIQLPNVIPRGEAIQRDWKSSTWVRDSKSDKSEQLSKTAENHGFRLEGAADHQPDCFTLIKWSVYAGGSGDKVNWTTISILWFSKPNIFPLAAPWDPVIEKSLKTDDQGQPWNKSTPANNMFFFLQIQFCAINYLGTAPSNTLYALCPHIPRGTMAKRTCKMSGHTPITYQVSLLFPFQKMESPLGSASPQTLCPSPNIEEVCQPRHPSNVSSLFPELSDSYPLLGKHVG